MASGTAEPGTQLAAREAVTANSFSTSIDQHGGSSASLLGVFPADTSAATSGTENVGPKALLTVCDDSAGQCWGVLRGEIARRLPLQDIQWSPHGGAQRTVPVLQPQVRIFDPEKHGVPPRTEPGSPVPVTPTTRDTLLNARPSVHMFLFACDENEVYRSTIRPRIQNWLAHFSHNRDQEWLIVHVTEEAPKPKLFNIKVTQSVIDKLRGDFSKDRKCERCVSMRITPFVVSPGETAPKNSGHTIREESMGELLTRLKERMAAAFEAALAERIDTVSQLEIQKFSASWNIAMHFLQTEALASCYENLEMHEKAAQVYEKLNVLLTECINRCEKQHNITNPQSKLKSPPSTPATINPAFLPSFRFMQTLDDSMGSMLFANSDQQFNFYLAFQQKNVSGLELRTTILRKMLLSLRHQNDTLKLVQAASLFLQQIRLEIERRWLCTLGKQQQKSEKILMYAYLLASVNSVLAVCNDMTLNQRLESDGLERLESAKLGLLLLSCTYMDALCYLRNGFRVFLRSVDTRKLLRSTNDAQSSTLYSSIQTKFIHEAMATKANFITTYMTFVEVALASAKMCGKGRVVSMLKGVWASLSFASARYEDCAAFLSEIAPNYVDPQWPLLHSDVMTRLAGCHRQQGNSREYLIAMVRLLAASLVFRKAKHVPAVKSRNWKPFGLARGVQKDELVNLKHSRELKLHKLAQVSKTVDVRLSFSLLPFFELRVVGPLAVSSKGCNMALTCFSIHNRMNCHVKADEIVFRLAGGETGDIEFFASSCQLLSGENKIELLCRRQSTGGVYIAESFTIKCGTMEFTTNFIKEKIKRTLHVHELPGPVAITVCQPATSNLKDPREFKVQLCTTNSNVQISNAKLTVTPTSPGSVIENIFAVEPVDPTETQLQDPNILRSASPSLANLTLVSSGASHKTFLVPDFSSTQSFVVRTGAEFSAVNVRFVLDYMFCENEQNNTDRSAEPCKSSRTVSLVETVYQSPSPVVTCTLQLVAKQWYLLFEIQNTRDDSLLIDSHSLVNSGEPIAEDCRNNTDGAAVTVLSGFECMKILYPVSKVPQDGQISGTFAIHFCVLGSEAAAVIKSRLRENLNACDAGYLLPVVWSAWATSVARAPWHQMLQVGAVRPEPGPDDSWMRAMVDAPPELRAKVQAANKATYESESFVSVDDVIGAKHAQRVAEYPIHVDIPACIIEYDLSICQPLETLYLHKTQWPLVTLGKPIKCKLEIRLIAQHSVRIEPESANQAVDVAYEVSPQDPMIWHVIGPTGRKLTLCRGDSHTVNLTLVALTSGEQALPCVIFYTCTNSRRGSSSTKLHSASAACSPCASLFPQLGKVSSASSILTNMTSCSSQADQRQRVAIAVSDASTGPAFVTVLPANSRTVAADGLAGSAEGAQAAEPEPAEPASARARSAGYPSCEEDDRVHVLV